MYYFFYFPVGTDQRLKRVPAVTISLVVVLAVAHYLLHYNRPTAGYFGALVLSTDAPTIFQAFTACFVHGDLFHLGGNLLYLITFGPALEDRIGRASMLGFYLVAGLVSMIVQVEAIKLLAPGAGSQMVLGASGAISGVLGLFAVRCWFLRVRVAHTTMALLQGVTRAGVTPIPAWIALGAWTLLQGVYTALSASHGGAGGTAYWAHLSGLALGLLVGLMAGLGKQGIDERFLVRGDRYLRGAKWFAALGEFQAYRERVGEETVGRLGEARALRILDRQRESAAAYARAFALATEEENWGGAREIAEEAFRVKAPLSLDPTALFSLATILEGKGNLIEAAKWYEASGRATEEAIPAAVALERAAELYRLRVGDLARAALLLENAAGRLAEAGDQRTAGGSTFLTRAAECRRVLDRRLEHAVQNA